MERTSSSARSFELLHRYSQRGPPLAFEILRANVRDIVALRIILETLIPGKWPAEQPSKPCDRTPTIPESWFHIIRSSIPLRDKDAVVFVRLIRERRVAEERRTRRGEVAEDKAAEGEDRGEDTGI